MMTFYRKYVLLLFSFSQCCLIAGPSAPKPLPALIEEADLVVMATLHTAAANNSGHVRSQLLPIFTLEGSYSTSTLTAALALPQTKTNQGKLVNPSEGSRTGVWFLQKRVRSTEYTILPLVQGNYSWSDAFLPIAASDWPLNQGTAEQQALQALLALYRFPKPDAMPISDLTVLINLDHANPELALALAETLIASPVKGQHIVGLASAIRLVPKTA